MLKKQGDKIQIIQEQDLYHQTLDLQAVNE
jgi:hypothetical protein